MYIAEIRIENFRLFGAGDQAFVLQLTQGLTALVGENDAGKTAVIDALRLVLGTRDQEIPGLNPMDFHQPAPGAERAEQICIRLIFRGLTTADRGAFAEFLNYETIAGATDTALIVTWVAKRNAKGSNSLACCRFRGHRDKVFNGTGELECREGSSAASSSLRR